jgi:hypothetical protein
VGRPNFHRMQRQQRDIASWVGETAQLRKYVSASAGNPAYGYGNEATFQTTTITGLFAPVLPEEIEAAGGVYIMGDVRLTPIDMNVSGNDEIVWHGATHHVVSDPLPQPIVGSAQRVLLRRGGQTG